MKLIDSFTQKVASKAESTVTKKQIRAAMHADAGYEEIWDRLAQAGGPNMTQPDAPMSDPSDITQITPGENWPDLDIARQVQDLRTQNVDDNAILQQMQEMGAGDQQNVQRVMQNLPRVGQIDDDMAPDTSAPKPSEINMLDQMKPPPGIMPAVPQPTPNAPNLSKDQGGAEKQALANSFLKYLGELQRKQSILLDEILKAEHPAPFGKGEVYTRADKQNLRKSIVIQQEKISRAGNMYKKLIKLCGPEMLATAETAWLAEELAKGNATDVNDVYVPEGSPEALAMDEGKRRQKNEENKGKSKVPKTPVEEAQHKDELARQKEIRRQKDLHPEDHPDHKPRVKKDKPKHKKDKDAPDIDDSDEKESSEDEPAEKDAQLGNQPAGTAASPMNGQRDSLSSQEIDGTGKIAVPNKRLSPEELKKMVQQHGMNDAFKAQPPTAPVAPAKPMPTIQEQQTRQDTFQEHMPKGKFGQVAPPPKAPAPAGPPAGGPPGVPPPAGAKPGGQPPIGPPSMDDDMGDDMPVDDMRSLVEVMSDLEEDFEALKEKLESGESILHGQDVEPVEDDTGSIPSGPPKIAVDDSAKDYYTSYYKEYGHQLTDDRVASILDLVDEVGVQYRSTVKSADMNRLARYIAARPRHAVELTDEKLTQVSDKIFINYLFKTGMVHDLAKPPALDVFKTAIWNSGEAHRIAKYAEGKMKSPKPKGQLDDAVKVDKMKDRADEKDSAKRLRPAHLPMELAGKENDGTYQFLDIEWDADHASAARSDAGMAQAVISFVKGLESTKEFTDLGFLGQIHIDEIDIDGGKATVHFRTKKLQGPLRVTKE